MSDTPVGSTILRPARPNHDEGLAFARYLDEAAEGFFGIMLGRNAHDIIATAFIDPNHSLSHEHVTFAERDGAIVGAYSAFTGRQRLTFSDAPLERAAGRSALRMKTMRVLFAPLWRILENVAEDEFYLQAIAVDPECRGLGIGWLLMEDIERCARASGATRMCLHVAVKNDTARRLYARQGMVDESEWPSPRFIPSVFVHMSKDL